MPLRQSILLVAAIAALFVLAAWGGIALTSGFDRIATIWFSNGIVVAALLMSGRSHSLWLALIGTCFCANLGLNLWLGDEPLVAVGIALSNAVEITVAGFALRSVLFTSADLLQSKALLRFFGVALIAAPTLAALIAAASLHAARGAPMLEVMRLWIPADALGMGVVAPLLLALRPRELLAAFRRERVGRLLAPLALLLVVTLGVFAQSRYPLLFLLLPPLLFVVFRLGFNGVAVAISLIAAVAIVFTLNDSGPFMLVAGASIAERVFTMQLLLGSLIATTYPVCAILAAQRRLRAETDRHLADLRESQATVRALNEQMTLAANAARVGFFSWNLVTGRVEWDAQVYKMFSIDPNGGRPTYEAWRSRVHPQDLARSERTLSEAIAAARDIDMEFRVLWPDGAARDIRCRGLIQRDAAGAAIRIVGLNIDVTDLRRLDRLKSEFVSIVSHELRTPLTSIRGALGLLASGRVPADKAPELVQLANRNAERLAVLIDDILDMEKIESGKMRFEVANHALAALMEQAVAANAPYAARHQVRLQLHNASADVHVSVDANRFLQVMANLLSNASKFSPQNAVVEISVIRRQDAVRIAVRDYGPGVSDEFRQKIFNKFCQGDASDSRQKGGSGLGLAISKALIEQMGGGISFITSAQTGTTFFVDLPISSPSAGYEMDCTTSDLSVALQ